MIIIGLQGDQASPGVSPGAGFGPAAEDLDGKQPAGKAPCCSASRASAVALVRSLKPQARGPLPRQRIHLAATILVAAVLCVPSPATAQTLPSGPIRAIDGRLLVNGEVVATMSATDNIAFFNYTDYEHNALRLFRFSLSGAWQPVAPARLRRRAADGGSRSPAGLRRLRALPALGRHSGFDIQAGRIPPSFGVFSRRAYTTDNPVIGYPLAYQYLTSIHPDAVPALAEDLIRMRARGWLSTFPVGNRTPGPGRAARQRFPMGHRRAGPLESRASSTPPGP